MMETAERVLYEFIPYCNKVAMVRSITPEHVHAYHVGLRKKGLIDLNEDRYLGEPQSYQRALT
jgi:hypothetical protein